MCAGASLLLGKRLYFFLALTPPVFNAQLFVVSGYIALKLVFSGVRWCM
jgi:hypothetical protein